MKKLACILIEIEEGEDLHKVLRQILVDPSAVGKQLLVDNNFNGSDVTLIPVERNVVFDDRSTNLTWEDRFAIIMAKFGINTTYKGYRSLYYIMGAIHENPEYQKNIFLKSLYACVTKNTGDSYTRIERQVRTVIKKIYELNSEEYVNNILNIHNDLGPKITNGDFIAALSIVVIG